ncbi:exodeoxyribonuclease V subunit alpha [Noviherbaspirillum sp. CPCC 100848]|uniref:RecBCD enzyme subunit RecD n=1 Tax=Noviherbaspirillum album TaxID=3080276 RepID=A0ABU6J8C6_9BURK|nr:exodeoxyribonuclease V subunit alpha [Noviherbaspirillum sp. CPCC 100848]MEC4719861.1 exodeoxyribonuclease V subunit alpha [Noviherbaspirillum sp. CPCC 100848]
MGMIDSAALFGRFDAFVAEGLLQRLGCAFARFIDTLGRTPPPVTLACAVLSELETRGHSCLFLSDLVASPCALLGWPQEHWVGLCEAAGGVPDSTEAWQVALAACDHVWVTGSADRNQPLVLDGERLYLRRYWRNETLVATAVAGRAARQRDIDVQQMRVWLDRLFVAGDAGAGSEPDWQKIACAIAMRSHLSIITGGPGTGKTYTVARLLVLLFALAEKPEAMRVALTAPTGKAATRLKQSIDAALDGLKDHGGDMPLPLPLSGGGAGVGAAYTLHSLLGARPDTRAFRHHAGNPLDIDVLIVDEASMVHLEMMAALLDALPPHAVVILLGDKDQLASVEAGAVLGDLCSGAEHGNYLKDTAGYIAAACGQTLPDAMLGSGDALAQQTVMLRKSRRFGGPVGVLASAINGGDASAASSCLRRAEDRVLSWIDAARQSDLLQLALEGRAGAEGGYHAYLRLLRNAPGTGRDAHEAWVREVLEAFEGFRLLCAVREGDWGVNGVNEAVESYFDAKGLVRRRGEWYVGRPVMITRNDASLGVSNGDIGIALPDPGRPDALRVYLLDGSRVFGVLPSRLPQVETAYATTVHKAQGSEFAHAVMVLPPDAGPVVTRELVYTGITRAKRHFTLVSPNAAVFDGAIARQTRRMTGLRMMLKMQAQAVAAPMPTEASRSKRSRASRASAPGQGEFDFG